MLPDPLRLLDTLALGVCYICLTESEAVARSEILLSGAMCKFPSSLRILLTSDGKQVIMILKRRQHPVSVRHFSFQIHVYTTLFVIRQ